MSAYEELVRRCYEGCEYADRIDVRLIIAEVLRTLEKPTTEMLEAASLIRSTQMIANAVWVAMIPASPLTPPKEATLRANKRRKILSIIEGKKQ